MSEEVSDSSSSNNNEPIIGVEKETLLEDDLSLIEVDFGIIKRAGQVKFPYAIEKSLSAVIIEFSFGEKPQIEWSENLPCGFDNTQSNLYQISYPHIKVFNDYFFLGKKNEEIFTDKQLEVLRKIESDVFLIDNPKSILIYFSCCSSNETRESMKDYIDNKIEDYNEMNSISNDIILHQNLAKFDEKYAKDIHNTIKYSMEKGFTLHFCDSSVKALLNEWDKMDFLGGPLPIKYINNNIIDNQKLILVETSKTYSYCEKLKVLTNVVFESVPIVTSSKSSPVIGIDKTVINELFELDILAKIDNVSNNFPLLKSLQKTKEKEYLLNEKGETIGIGVLKNKKTQSLIFISSFNIKLTKSFDIDVDNLNKLVTIVTKYLPQDDSIVKKAYELFQESSKLHIIDINERGMKIAIELLERVPMCEMRRIY